MTVIGTVGLPGSGKGEAAEVAREEGVPVVTMGDVVRDACRERGLDPAEHHGDVARQLREENGPDAIAARSIPTVREHLADPAVDTVLVDGLRAPVEAERFEDAFDEEFVLVAVAAPFEVRAERLGARGRDDSDVDRAALREREERELGFGMGEAMATADLTVDNVGGLEGYRDVVRRLLRAGPAAVEGAEQVRPGGATPADAGTAGDGGSDG
jgi:dephospho-CoA kinase